MRLHRELPLTLALLGAAAACWEPARPVAAASLLFCPGWGLLRVLSVIDRHFGVGGASLVLSTLVTGLAGRAGAAAGLAPTATVAGLHLVTVVLCIAGRMRLVAHDRWLAGQPPHPAPMPMGPRGELTAALLVVAAVAAVAVASPSWTAASAWAPAGASAARPALDPSSSRAADAVPDPLRTETAPGVGRAQRDAGPHPPDLLHAAAATLALAGGSDVLPATWLLAASALTAMLLLAGEAASRLWGNEGARAAMVVALLGCAPWPPGGTDGTGGPPRTMLGAFLVPSDEALALACLALLLSSTLSVVRRASTHVPALVGAAASALALAHPGLAVVLLPGWTVGLVMAHLACRNGPDNDPVAGRLVRRDREPLILRAPLWRPLLHLAAGLALVAPLIRPPALGVDIDPGRLAGQALAVGPSAILWGPGVRHLNATPGREAFFFVGVVVLAALLTGGLDADGAPVARALSLVLAVPAAVGVAKLLAWRPRAGRVLCVVLVAAALPAAVLDLATWRARPPVPAAAGGAPSGARAASPVTAPPSGAIPAATGERDAGVTDR